MTGRLRLYCGRGDSLVHSTLQTLRRSTRGKEGRRSRDSDKHTEDENVDEQDEQAEDTTTGGTALRHATTLDGDVAG